jgi:hypothetical protein
MEAMRLDLLSLEAGLVSVPDVTRHLEEATRLASVIDEALRGRDAGTATRDVVSEATPV